MLPRKLLWFACFCVASVISKKLSARVWQPSQPGFEFPETAQDGLSDHLQSKPDFGIALAGGGMRGLGLGHGIVRTLREAGLLEKARYLSVTSGSVWLGIPLQYQTIDSLEDYLGTTLQPEEMSPEALLQKTGTGIRRLTHFPEYPKNHSAKEGVDRRLRVERGRKDTSGLVEMFDCPADEGWCACMVDRFQPGHFHSLYQMLAAYVFLHPFDLAGRSSTHCHETQLDRLKAKFGNEKTIYTAKDISRNLPFLVSQSAILAPYTGLNQTDRLEFFPLEQTSLYVGSPQGFEASSTHNSIGDVLIEPFAWGSETLSPWTNFSNGDELMMDVAHSLINVGDLASWAGIATSYVADFQIRSWADKIPKCLIAETEKMLPHERLWSPLELDASKVPVSHDEAVGDAGVYDDIGHIPLLRRRTSKIAIFNSGAIHHDLCEMTYLLAAFGQPGCLKPPNRPGASNPKMKAGALTVFEPSEFPAFWAEIEAAWRANESAVVRGRYTVVDNEALGVKGGWQAEVLWVIIMPSKSFRSSLPSRTAEMLSQFFPNEWASDMSNRFEMSVSSQYGSWLMQRSGVSEIQKMLQDPAEQLFV